MRGRTVDLSVIVVVYNQPESLRLILKSLLAQDFSGSYEIIVTDDGSLIEILLAFQEECRESTIPVKYTWQSHCHFRAAAARNNGINISSGKVLLFLDGDLVPALDTLRMHIEAHTSLKMMVAGNRKWRGELSSIKHQPNEPIGEVIKYLEDGFPVDDKSRQREEVERRRRKQWFASTHPWRACFSGNVSVGWSQDVWFDENFVGWGPEDWEFNHRLCTKHGYTPIYLDDITTYHLETPDAVGNIFRVGKHEEIVMYMKNTLYFFDKNPGELPIEEVFFGFSRFVLNKRTNKWQIVPRPEPGSYDTEAMVAKARQWLSDHGEK